MRPLDYDGKNDGLYPRCMCGASWSAHDETGRCPTQLIGTSEAGAVSRVQRYRPMIGKFGRTKNKPLKTYSEVFGHPFDEDALYEADDAGARFISKYDDEVFKAEHSITIRQATMVAMAAHGIKCFPDECCGFVLGRYLSGCCDDAGCPYLDDMEEVRPITNINRYKGGAYLMHPGQQIKTLAEMELRGMKLKVVFHSHPNMSAFFSSIDRDAARSISADEADWPETVWIVMSIRDHGDNFMVRPSKRGKPHLADARAYLWNPAIKDFSEITLKVN